MTTLEIAALIAAAALALTRLLKTAKPLWDYLPDFLQPLPPILVAWLPQLAEIAGQATTKLDLADMLLLTIAVLVPGMHSRRRGAAVGMVAVFLAFPVVQGCQQANRPLHTANAIAQAFCERSVTADLVEMAVDAYCARPEVVDYFIDELARAEAKAVRSLPRAQ